MGNVGLREHFEELEVSVPTINSLLEVEKQLLSVAHKAGIPISHDCMADEPLAFFTLGYGVYAGTLMVYPLSTTAYSSFLQSQLLYSQKPSFDGYFLAPTDKYKTDENYQLPGFTDLVVLCGSNLLGDIVDRDKLVHLSRKGAYAKLHPFTDDYWCEEIQKIFGSKVIDGEVGLYKAFNKAETIHTTGASESAAYAARAGKGLKSIEVAQHQTNGSFRPIVNHLFFDQDNTRRQQYLNSLVNSEISMFFHPEDPDVINRIERAMEFLKNRYSEF